MQTSEKIDDSNPDSRFLIQDTTIFAGWPNDCNSYGKDYVSLSIAAPEFGPRKLYANLGRATGQDDESLYPIN